MSGPSGGHVPPPPDDTDRVAVILDGWCGDALTEFLFARIVDDAANGDPYAHPSWCESHTFPYPDSLDPGECSCGAEERWLAEVRAKRRIVETFVDMDTLPNDERIDQRVTLRWVCESLAGVYADHPDYRQEWAQ